MIDDAYERERCGSAVVPRIAAKEDWREMQGIDRGVVGRISQGICYRSRQELRDRPGIGLGQIVCPGDRYFPGSRM